MTRHLLRTPGLLALGLAFTLTCAAAAPAGPAAADAPASQIDLLGIMGDAGVTPAQITDVKTLLLAKRQLLVVDLAGKKSRLQWLDQALAELQAQTDKAISEDPTILALNQSLAAWQQQLQTALGNHASGVDIASRQAEISREIGTIAERRDAIRLRIGEALLPQLASLQLTAQADVHELESDLAAIDAQLAKIAKSGVAAKG